MSEYNPATPLSDESAEFSAQTIDITSWFNTDLSASGSFDMGIMAAASFCKLLDVLAVPALLVDWTYSVVFANQSCGRLAANFKSIEGVPFSSLVPRSANAEKAQSLIRKVFRTRRAQVADGILELDARKIWGRLYFRSVRLGPERFVLLLIEDVTGEKTQLLLSQRKLQQNKELISQADEKLRHEMRRLEKARQHLRIERQRFNALSELVPGGCAIIGSDGTIEQSSPKFKNYFDLEGDADSVRTFGEVLDWLRTIKDTETDVKTGVFCLKSADGTTRFVKCSASRIRYGEYLLFCEDQSHDR